MSIQCKNIIISRTLFERNLRDVDTRDFCISVDRGFATNKDAESKEVRLTVKMVLGDKKAGYKTPFYSELEIMGFFEWDAISEEELEKEVVGAGMPIIFSFARVRLYELCQQAGLSTIILPELDIENM